MYTCIQELCKREFYMTNEELAMHWKVSLKDVRNISNIINYQYSVELISGRENSENVWQVVLRANDKENDYILMEEGSNFSDKDQAIVQGTRWARSIKMTPGQAQLMGVPVDAFLSLNPIKGYQEVVRKFMRPVKRKILNTHPHD